MNECTKFSDCLLNFLTESFLAESFLTAPKNTFFGGFHKEIAKQLIIIT